jgi:hypothetical protein
MKKLLTLAALVGATTLSFAQGYVNFANSSATLISAGGVAAPGAAGAYYYAVFLAPSTTVTGIGQSAGAFDNPIFQVVGGTNTSIATAGRMATRNALNVGGTAGGTADFLVRGWSANAGATWSEALAFYNNLGSSGQSMWLGQSVIGNDIVLGDGGALPNITLFGVGLNQVGGFNLTQFGGTVPEPSSMALAGIGAASLLLFRRRK